MSRQSHAAANAWKLGQVALSGEVGQILKSIDTIMWMNHGPQRLYQPVAQRPRDGLLKPLPEKPLNHVDNCKSACNNFLRQSACESVLLNVKVDTQFDPHS